jgi:hypothetical protein
MNQARLPRTGRPGKQIASPIRKAEIIVHLFRVEKYPDVVQQFLNQGRWMLAAIAAFRLLKSATL